MRDKNKYLEWSVVGAFDMILSVSFIRGINLIAIVFGWNAVNSYPINSIIPSLIVFLHLLEFILRPIFEYSVYANEIASSTD
jgi:hypothetical protein